MDIVSKELAGKGAFGEVYKVVTSDGQIFALKEVKLDLFEPEEIRLLKDVSLYPQCHKHVLCFVHEDEKNGIMQLWFEYLGGGNLDDFVSKHKFTTKGPAYFAMVHDLIKQLLQALDYVHNKGIAHRDIKLENVMLTENGDLKLIDFGIGCKGCETTKTYPGTVPYIPPSIYKKLDTGERITFNDMIGHDLFATGYLLVMLLTKGFWPPRTYAGRTDVYHDMDIYRQLIHTSYDTVVKGDKNFIIPQEYDYLSWLAAKLLTEQLPTTEAALNQLKAKEAPDRMSVPAQPEQKRQVIKKRPRRPARRRRARK